MKKRTLVTADPLEVVVLPTERIPLDEIDDNPIQPPNRTDAIDGLVEDVRTTSIIAPLLLVKKVTRYTLIDGHRRKAVAARLKFPSVPAIVMESDLPATYLFLLFNRSIRNVNPAQLFFAWAHETTDGRMRFLERMPRPTRRNIEELIKIFGEPDVLRLADGIFAPHTVHWIKLARMLITNFEFEAPPLRKIGRWVIEHDEAGVVNLTKRRPDLDKKHVRQLLDAIVANRKLAKQDLIGKRRVRKTRPAAAPLRAVGA